MFILRMFSYARLIVFVFALTAFTGCWAKDNGRVAIEDAQGNRHTYNVEYALTKEEKAQGLMFREQMAENRGMLFVYPQPQVLHFWMKNTLIPLDMLFFDMNKKLVHIEHSAIPHDERPRGPNIPVCYVLEVNGGQAIAKNIKKGARLIADLSQECLLPMEKTGK